MQIILDQDAASWIFEEFQKWEKIGNDRLSFPNWKRSSVDRENRRESYVYSNCAEYLCCILRNAVDDKGDSWWVKLNAAQDAGITKEEMSNDPPKSPLTHRNPPMTFSYPSPGTAWK